MTRRGITSTISSIFDPLGLVSPITLRAKIMLQDLCRQSMLGTDDTIPLEKQEKWLNWKASLPELKKMSIPRCYKSRDILASDAQLHLFSDGSELGYGACAYLRLVDTAVVACRLYELIRDELEIKLNSVTFWTDSVIVLGYIRNISRRFKTFVANRLSIIQELNTADQWRHIDT